MFSSSFLSKKLHVRTSRKTTLLKATHYFSLIYEKINFFPTQIERGFLDLWIYRNMLWRKKTRQNIPIFGLFGAAHRKKGQVSMHHIISLKYFK